MRFTVFTLRCTKKVLVRLGSRPVQDEVVCRPGDGRGSRLAQAVPPRTEMLRRPVDLSPEGTEGR